LKTFGQAKNKEDLHWNMETSSAQCFWPWQGFTIDSLGYITICCNSRDMTPWQKHISEVDSLLDFWHGEEYLKLRIDMANEGWHNLPSCANCRKGTNLAPLYHSNTLYEEGHVDVDVKNFLKPRIFYLEFSTSNVCNQTCVMCDSSFSSLWQKIEHKFDRKPQPTYSYADKEIDKILEIIPNIKHIQLKGGEPFADVKNIKIIKAMGPESHITICSNLQNIPKQIETEIVKNPDGFSISASIDGIGKIGNWIRGGDFDKVCKNMERLHDKCGIVFNNNVTLSIYNVEHLREIYEFFKDKPYIKPISFSQNSIVLTPKWCSVVYLLEQEELDTIIDKQFSGTNIEIGALKRIKCLGSPKSRQWHHHTLMKHTKTMNSIRGFDIPIGTIYKRYKYIYGRYI